MNETRHAVVLGAGIAGLLAARVLAEHFSRVTVVERDGFDIDGMRKGVPQARHLHGLLDRGRTIIEELFPGFTAEMAARGATIAEALVDTRWYVGGLRAAPASTGLTSVIATRPLLESMLRERTSALPEVRLMSGVARGLIGDARRVRAVAVSGESGDETHATDLVVDASGRGSRASVWLTALGAQPPDEQRIEVDLGYASQFYRRTEGQLDGQSSVIISTGANGRGGGAIRVEGERWHVTLAGILGDHPPTDPDGFARFAASLAAPDIHDIVRSAESLGDAVPHRFRAPVRRRYPRRAAVPDGFLMLGDALCSFNPLYAQGMAVAAQQAIALRECLRDGGPRPDLPARFYRAADKVLDVAWQLSAGADLAHPGVTGPRTARTRFTNAYVARVHRAAHVDPRVARTFLRVANLVEPPAALLHPLLTGRILLRGGASWDPSQGIRPSGPGPVPAPGPSSPPDPRPRIHSDR
ncbi:FAD-dependent monooxygenase [Nocardia sp. NBC_00508]|uniref:FAD-dependent oxidoreductase n=1 Tax=Nocardia sp. NBC_00508 TaxID=2975992 RepID=UPI002E811172|nr:FAD-dependent monooxygenase [Nocardia sp. NBC_00508]WUD67262.1 FAD-dependent monooxygenase [Nocardia sp. NBC_00508]